jgi:hypothetical protein
MRATAWDAASGSPVGHQERVLVVLQNLRRSGKSGATIGRPRCQIQEDFHWQHSVADQAQRHEAGRLQEHVGGQQVAGHRLEGLPRHELHVFVSPRQGLDDAAALRTDEQKSACGRRRAMRKTLSRPLVRLMWPVYTTIGRSCGSSERARSSARLRGVAEASGIVTVVRHQQALARHPSRS